MSPPNAPVCTRMCTHSRDLQLCHLRVTLHPPPPQLTRRSSCPILQALSTPLHLLAIPPSGDPPPYPDTANQNSTTGTLDRGLQQSDPCHLREEQPRALKVSQMLEPPRPLPPKAAIVHHSLIPAEVPTALYTWQSVCSDQVLEELPQES
ncbi:tubby-related protein 4 [Lates japonicus]|uniref:Tubby-related protein 4 n=1 Tax=Lates japonicus TaxID=270547 RepID=A0AAD3NI29_LATJO|nr:tubby-related protein 4 [Lates japonicus]